MKKVLVIGAFVIGAMFLTGCDRVEPGYVGIKVDRTGDNKGVGEVITGGRVWTGINADLYTFPTFKQMTTYDQPLTFQMSDGTQVGHKIGIAYLVDQSKVVQVFKTYRKGVDEITASDMHQDISDALNRRASMMTTDDFIDGGKSKLLDEVLTDVRAKMGPNGINVLSISWVGAPDYPPTVRDSINAKVRAKQQTLQREQEVKQKEAEANMARAQAAGEADAKIALADAEAKSIEIRGAALRDNPEVIKLQWIDKWDGKLPTTQLGNDAQVILNK